MVSIRAVLRIFHSVRKQRISSALHKWALSRMNISWSQVQGKTLQEIIDQYFVPKTKVECDGYRSYLNLEGVELNAKKYETDDLHWVHKAMTIVFDLSDYVIYE